MISPPPLPQAKERNLELKNLFTELLRPLAPAQLHATKRDLTWDVCPLSHS